MKILLINSVCGIRSTGRICTDIAEEQEKQGHEVKIAYGRETVPEKYQKYAVCIGSEWSVRKNALSCRLFDNDGFAAKRATKKFLEWAEEYNPDMLWLHNLHGYYINIEMLFAWIKSHPNMQVKWTLHDCWAFTGHCTHFAMAKCDRWRTHCLRCVQKRRYPASYFMNNCTSNYTRKKAAFTGVQNMTLITPSQWLANLVKQSFLSKYLVAVKYNKIDTTVFQPTPSDFRERYRLTDKKIVLGVASSWSESKGLNDFIKLSEMLDESYAIVLVGLTDKQLKKLLKKIKGIQRTNSVKELTEVYTAADVFVNPSREESFGLTTAESESCGTDAIVYKGTACEEVVNQFGGKAVNDSVDAIYNEIIKITSPGKMYEIVQGAILIAIQRTNNTKELAAIYSAADVFVNPTYEDNYPTVNLEAQACGTPVITYNTGGCTESIDATNGTVVQQSDVFALVAAINNYVAGRPIA